MDLKDYRKQIMERYFPVGGLIIASFLGVFGFGFIMLSGIYKVRSLEELYQIISNNGFVLIVMTFFFIIAIVIWIAFIQNILVKPKKDILFLYKSGNTKYFLDRKGKKYDNYECDKKEYKYYYVLKTRDYVYEVLQESLDSENNFEPIEKLSYWRNLYLPFGKFENVVLLPILYIIFIPAVLSFLMSEGSTRLVGIFLMIMPGFFIIYDLIYKIKRKKVINKILNEPDSFEKKERLDNINNEKELVNMGEKVSKGIIILEDALKVIFSFSFVIFTIWVFVKGADLITRLAIIPFFICAVAVFISSILPIKERIDQNKIDSGKVNEKKKRKKRKRNLSKIVSNIYAIGFLLFWFGFLIFFTIGITKQEGYTSILFTLPFWGVGFFAIYFIFVKK